MDWKRTLHNKIIDRNRKEFGSLQHYDAAYFELWTKYNRWEHQRVNLRHKLHLMEYSIHESSVRSNPSLTVSNMRKQLISILAELNDFEPSPRLNLSKIIYEQNRLLQHQAEELELAKEELKRAMEQIALLSAPPVESVTKSIPTTLEKDSADSK